MRHFGSPFRLPPRWRWLVGPAIALGGGGTAVAMWLEEEGIALAECAPLAALPAMAGLLYVLNHLIFKAARLRREDLEKSDQQETTIGGH